MGYLAERRIVHKRLTLRNVLAESLDCVKVTGFGRAAPPDVTGAECTEDGGEMLIKWMAPECIHERMFSHRSDVWAFGEHVFTGGGVDCRGGGGGGCLVE